MYDDVPPHEERRLSPEELEKQIARLTAPSQPVEIRDPFPVCPAPKLPASEIDKITERLYTQSLQKKAASVAELEQQTYRRSSRPPRAMTSTEQDEAVHRLYDEGRQRQQSSLEESRRRYLFHSPDEGREKQIPLKDFTQRMYYDRLKDKADTEKRLYDKYIATTEIRTAVISRAEADEAAARLSSVK